MLVKLFALATAVVGGMMLADVLTHPKGTKAAGDVLVSLEKNTGNQLIGQ